jgi:hypothetical protein
LIRSLNPVLRMWKVAYYRWALRSLSTRAPMHEDIPWLVLRIHALENAR